ncbi:MAG: deoxyribose-phosphate aldolase [Lachnospiraceae bacterium]|nr:deoxyribose-phosphate aldolase [Lachnospiraceae bacterium]
MEINRSIDTSPLNPVMTTEEVEAAIREGIEHESYSVCVQPCDIPLAAKLCAGTKTKVCCVLDFPHGKSPKKVKAFMASTYCELGAEELDMVMNYGYALSGKWDLLEDEIRAVTEEAHRHNAIVKVILEAGVLTPELIAKATEVSIAAGADFVKTSTGFNGGGATKEQLQIMLDTAKGRCAVKASGGIRDYETAKSFLDMGVGRIGVGSSSFMKLIQKGS